MLLPTGKRMIWTRDYVARFTNEFGEEWEFEYHPVTNTGTLRGSDIDWKSYPVIDGRAVGLILDEDEISWLRRVWADAATGGCM
jgi:hypothetical protein